MIFHLFFSLAAAEYTKPGISKLSKLVGFRNGGVYD
jgi:hypothetical protein